MYFTIWAMMFLNSTGIRHFDAIRNRFEPILDVTAAESIYKGCGSTKFCVGVPSNCVAKKNCQAFAARFVRDGKYIFEMRSKPQAAYVASALSFDRRMGDDSVIECVHDGNNNVDIFSSYTIREHKTFDSIRYGIPQDIIRLVEAKIENGAIYCQVERDEVSTVSDIKFDLKHGKFYLLLASGSKVKKDRITVHNLGHAVSKELIR